MKRFTVYYESDRVDRMSNIGEHNHYYGCASTIRTARSYISKIRNKCSDENPRNFRVYDSWGEVDEKTEFVPCVYQEQ